ncbi:MAG: TolC family protein [Saprospiraceae bacterium]|nr:TolC family protein [Saprospiraceae bacterium]
MNLRSTLLLILCTIVSWNSPLAQEVWSLQRCVQHALDNSLALQQTRLDVSQAEIDLSIAKQERIPSLNGSSSYSFSFGRRIDPTTNDFINQEFSNQNLSINSGVTLYNGGRIRQQIRQSQLGSRAASLEAEQMESDISLEVAQAYLAILFAIENAGNAIKSLDESRAQLNQIDRLIEAGSRPKNARLDLLAQEAQNEQFLIAAENEIDLAHLTLKHLLQLDASFEMEVEQPDVNVPSEYETEVLNADQIYQQAMKWQPKIRAGELKRENAEIGVLLSKTVMLPSISIGGSLGSNYSSVARRQGDITGSQLLSQPGIFINGESVNFEISSPTFGFNKVNYFDQLNENFGYGAGVSLNVPIYSQGQGKASLESAKLNVIRTDIANKQVKNQLKTDIQRSVADVKAAKKQYEAAIRTAEATRVAFEDTQKRFDLGVANSFELTTAQNTLDQAEVDLLISKYDYIFKAKVLDYYQGIPINLN